MTALVPVLLSALCRAAAARADRHGRTCEPQLGGLDAAAQDAAIEKFIAAKGGTPIVENQTRLIFLAKDKDGHAPRIVGDFNGWAATPQGYDAAIGKTDADRRHVVVVPREHVVHERAPRVWIPVRQGIHAPIR